MRHGAGRQEWTDIEGYLRIYDGEWKNNIMTGNGDYRYTWSTNRR